MFGSQLPVSLGGKSPLDSMPVTPPDMPGMIIPQKAGMFGGKFGIGQAIVAALNGYLAGSPGPGQQVGLQNIQMLAAQHQRQLEHQQELANYDRQRGDTNADWQSHYNYELAHPKDTAGSEYERLLSAAGIAPGTPAYQQHVTAKVNQLENPMVMTPYGPMPYSQVNPPAPTAPVGKLTPIDGGPTQGGSGGFPY